MIKSYREIFTLEEIQSLTPDQIEQLKYQSHIRIIVDSSCIEKILESARKTPEFVDVYAYNNKGIIQSFQIFREFFIFATCLSEGEGIYMLTSPLSKQNLYTIIQFLYDDNQVLYTEEDIIKQ